MQPPPDACNTIGDPIVVPTGAVYRAETDFATADGRLRIDRLYRNQTMTGARIAFGEPRGLAKRWRFGFAVEMHMNAFFKPDGTVWVHMPDGGSYGFTRDPATGAMNPLRTADHPLPQSTFKLRFIGTWPERLNRMHDASTRWQFSDSDDRTWLLETQPHFVQTSQYLIARPIRITDRDGYRWTLTYGDNHRLERITDSFGRTLTFTWIVRDYAGLPNLNWPAMPLAVSRIALPDGRTIHYTYDALATDTGVTEADRLNKVEIKTALGNIVDQTSYAYTDARWPLSLTAVTDAKGVQITTFTYDDFNRGTNTQEIGGVNSVTIAYSDTRRAASQRTRTVTNALGKQEVWVYRSPRGTMNDPQLVGKRGRASNHCPASATSLTYGADNFVATETDEEGRVTAYVRDALGRPTSVTRGFGTPEAMTTTTTYYATLNVPVEIIEPGLTTTLTWNDAGRLTRRELRDTTSHTQPYATSGQTRTWTYTYGHGGRLTAVDGPLPGPADITRYAYDDAGNLTTVTNAVGHVTRITAHNAAGHPLAVVDANGVTTTFVYDANHRLTTITVAADDNKAPVAPGKDAAATAFVYDAIGQITRIREPDGSSFTYTYDDARRLIAVASSDGETITFAHDLMGNVIATEIKAADPSPQRDGAAAITYRHTQMFDELGRLLRRIGAADQTTRYAYERNGNLAEITDPRAGVTRYAYDAVNRLIRETDQIRAAVTTTHDGQGNVAALTDPRGLATTYVRNGFGEVIRRVSPETGTTTYVRDAAGRVTRMSDARGVITNTTYDAIGRILTRTYPASPAENIANAYDHATTDGHVVGRLGRISDGAGTTRLRYDARGNTTIARYTIAEHAHTVHYRYDPADRVREITYPSGRQVRYQRDRQGRITTVDTRRAPRLPWRALASDLTYQPTTRLLATMRFANGLVLTNTWDLDHRLTRCQLRNGMTALIDKGYVYGDGLNLTAVNDNLSATANQRFTY